ncbi:MAG: extracellular solute-binding protein, partial [Oscillospiraceae bacterium]|nr:extracellular solute-binding protein [Oscillospiraceae bacterium]
TAALLLGALLRGWGAAPRAAGETGAGGGGAAAPAATAAGATEAATTAAAGAAGAAETTAATTAAAAAATTAASAAAATAADAADADNFNELGTFPIVKEMEEIIVVRFPQQDVADIDSIPMTAYMEEKTNVRVKWVIFPLEQFKERLSIAFAGGDPMDVIIRGNAGATSYSASETIKLANQGFLLPIEGLVETDSVNLKARFEADPRWEKAQIFPDGHIYGLPNYNECFHCYSGNRMYINYKFLEALGMEEPQTTEEFRDFLQRVVSEDPNQNGINDEIGLVGCSTNAARLVSTFIMMSAYAYDDGNNRIYRENGVVKAGFMQDGYREGLKYLNELYDEKLIYPESFTQDVATAVALNSQKYESIVGALANMHYGTVGTREDGQPKRQTEYMGIGPLQGPGGRRVAYWNYASSYGAGSTGNGFIPANCSNPRLVMRWIDYGYSYEGTMDSYMGQEGYGWEQPDAGATGVDGSPALYKPMSHDQSSPLYGRPVAWGETMPLFLDSTIRLGRQQSSDQYAPDGSGEEAHYYAIVKDKYQPYAISADEVLPILFYDEDEAAKIAQYQATINTYVNESIARFIIGDLDIDSGADWDGFLRELEKLGIDEYLAVIQGACEKVQ